MKISKEILKYALGHIVKNGDTDIFPFPFELKFYEAKFDTLVDSLATQDYANYSPMSLVESLVPKTKYGFRVAHQPYPSDTVVYTALVCSIIDDVEIGRADTFGEAAFSYRKSNGLSDPFFVPERHFKDWTESLEKYVFSDEFSHVIRTDISDFYMRIYRHRLENILDSLSGKTPIVKKIEKVLAVWRGGQSFGIPVGSDASRLLAEATLHDLDMALMSEGYKHTRYVDDIIILVQKGQDPYAALAFLAKHLSENEGLSLNNQKTTIFEWEDYLALLQEPNADDEVTKENWAVEKLFWAAYAQEELDEEALAALMSKDLVKELETCLSEKFWDMGAIRIILHAMRLVGSDDIADYIRKNLGRFIPFSKDVCLLIEHFVKSGSTQFDGVSAELTDLILSETMKPLDCARSWFLELGVRGHVNFSSGDVRKLESLTGSLDLRQLHLLRWRLRDINYFRSRKAKLSEIHVWAQPTFIFGASCLPKDEYYHWVRSLRSRLQFPLAKEFCDWCIETHGSDPFV